jgi:hypothetical protein
MSDNIFDGDTLEVKTESVVDGDNPTVENPEPIEVKVEVKEEKVEETHKSSPTGELSKKTLELTKDGFLKTLKNKFFGKEEKGEITDTSGLEEVKDDEISDKFIEVARESGWNDKDISEFAKNYNNKELVDLIPFLKEEKKEETALPGNPPKGKIEPKAEKVEQKQETIQEKKEDKTSVEELKKIIEQLLQEKIGPIKESLHKAEQDRTAKAVSQYQESADDFFDRTAKDFPVFGSTKELIKFPEGTPRAGQIVPAGKVFEARNAVWKTATAFHQTGETWTNSLQEALDWYKGKNAEKDIHSRIVKELKSNEKRLSPKRTEHKVEKKFANEQEEKVAIIEEAMEKAGIRR